MSKLPKSCVRRTLLLVSLMASVGLTGCASLGAAGEMSASDDRGPSGTTEVSAGGGSSESERLRREVRPFAELGWVLDWTAPLGDADRIEHTQPLGDLVLLQDDRNVVTVRSATSGGYRWTQQIENPLVNFRGHRRADDVTFEPLGTGERWEGDALLSVSDTEVFVRDMATGNLLGRQRFRVPVSTPPLLRGDELIIGTTDGQLLFHDWRRGVFTKSYGVGGVIRTPPAMLANGDEVVGVSISGGVAIVDASTGEAGDRRFEMFAGAAKAPATDERTAYVASLDQSVYAFDSVTAQQRWRYRTDRRLRSAPTAHGGQVFVPVPGTGLVALDSRTGAERWITEGLDDSEVIATRGGELVAWNGSTLRIIESDTGDVIEEIALPLVSRITPDGFEEASLYVEFDSGRLARFRTP